MALHLLGARRTKTGMALAVRSDGGRLRLVAVSPSQALRLIRRLSAELETLDHPQTMERPPK